MILTLRYQDEKSDKFWRVETAGCEMMTNWGRTGTSGRYEIKEFASEEECEKQAAKLAASKQKKGYRQMGEFDPYQHCYFDTDEWGPHPLTSHPAFRTYFSDEFYYDCGDENAPFGSDEGSDALHELQDLFRKRPKFNFADFPRFLIEEEWELTYLPPIDGQTDEELKTQAKQIYNSLPGDQELLQTDQVILATAFGQIKMTGKLDPALQRLACQSLERMEKMDRILWNWSKPEPPDHITLMRRDLSQFIDEEPD